MKLFHVSEVPSIQLFEPRPSPSAFESISGDVVFAISDKLLHNYLMPRDCPRVTFYAGPLTSEQDRIQFLDHGDSEYVVSVESKWLDAIRRTVLFCYELPTESFHLLDECAGYYISYESIKPVSIERMDDLLRKLTSRQVELRIMPSLKKLVEAVVQSTMSYSLIRMRNASTSSLPENH